MSKILTPFESGLPVGTLRAVIPGRPVAQGSKRAFRNKATGKMILVESGGDELRQYRVAIKRAMREAAEAAGWTDRVTFPVWPQGMPVALRVTFWFVRPAGHYGTGRNARTIKASAPRRPTGRPDLSKLVRAVEDAGSDTWWRDDSQIARVEIEKRYADLGMPEGTAMTAWQLEAEEPEKP